MKIEVHPKQAPIAIVQLEENEPMELANALLKLTPYIDENKKLGFNSKSRLRVTERELIIDFIDRLNNASNHIKNID